MQTERDFTGSEVKLHHAEGPRSGPPLLLIHGVTRRWQDFVTLLPALTLRHHVLAIDQRGHGKSSRAGGRYHVVDYIRDAVDFLRSAISEPTIVYGHSLGAMVAAGAAAEAPDRVRALVLEDPPFDTMGYRIRETPFQAFFEGLRETLAVGERTVAALASRMAEIRMPKMLEGGGLSTETVRLGSTRDATALRFGARCLLDVDPGVLTPIIDGRWLDGYDRDAILRRIECPTLLLQADYTVGGMLSDRDAASAVSLLRQGSHVKLDRVGHQIHWLAPEATARLVCGFLESIGDSPLFDRPVS